MTRLKCRAKCRGKYTSAQIEFCARVWDSAYEIQEIRNSTNTKVSYEAVFRFYRRQLAKLGVESVAQFKSIFRASQARGISRAFEQREHEIKFGASGSTMAAETLALARDTNARVRRIDARGADRRGGRKEARERQEACFRYWELGLTKEAVRNASNGRPRHEDVFDYYRRELAEIGVETSEEFKTLLVRRQKRLSQSAQATASNTPNQKI